MKLIRLRMISSLLHFFHASELAEPLSNLVLVVKKMANLQLFIEVFDMKNIFGFFFFLSLRSSPTVFVSARFFAKCDIAQHLEEMHVDSMLGDQWICLSETLSRGNASFIDRDRYSNNRGPNDECPPYSLGLFQISNEWCKSEGDPLIGTCKRDGCNLECSKLLDDDITDDIECLRKIYDIEGDQAWNMWPSVKVQNCRDNDREHVDGFNYTHCIIEFRAAKDKRQLATIPLWAALIIVAFACFLVSALTYAFYRYRQRNPSMLTSSEIKEFKYGRMKPIVTSPSNLRMSMLIADNFASEPYNVNYEISSKDFTIDYNECLGGGAYGIVYKATCKGKVVAVKALKPFTTKDYVHSLLGEIKILAHIGRHDFIVNLEGAHTKDLRSGVVFVFMEYCGLGSLEKYLRSKRAAFNFSLKESTEDDLKFEDLEDASDMQNPGTGEEVHLTFKHLLQYAHQIAKGMEFLSSKQVIHSDLAARNILLVDENTTKISDFGLSRKLYGYINYIKKKEEPLPWRWMAIESLKEMNFSTASDVWMYGVLLWEIFTLGDVPYPGLSWSLDFVEKLENGFRMLRPKFAPVNVYKDVMLKCWENNPVSRPSFTELANRFYIALDKITSVDYTKVEEPLVTNNLSRRPSRDIALKNANVTITTFV